MYVYSFIHVPLDRKLQKKKNIKNSNKSHDLFDVYAY